MSFSLVRARGIRHRRNLFQGRVPVTATIAVAFKADTRIAAPENRSEHTLHPAAQADSSANGGMTFLEQNFPLAQPPKRTAQRFAVRARKRVTHIPTATTNATARCAWRGCGNYARWTAGMPSRASPAHRTWITRFTVSQRPNFQKHSRRQADDLTRPSHGGDSGYKQ